jgi:acyl-CoA synthetase (AMP-forming)/AMP-acid ligase II
LQAAPVRDGGLGLRLLASNEAVPCSEVALGPQGPAFILQSSGTTAEPKLIAYSHKNMMTAAARVMSWFNLRKDDRCLSVTPVYYCHGLTLTVFAPLLSGGSVAFPTSSSRIDMNEWFVSLEPTWLSGSPTLLRAILEKARAGDCKPISHSLRFVLSGGAPLQPEIQLDLQSALGAPVLEHYGATEAAQISSCLPTPRQAKLGTCGIPPHNTVVIVGDDGTRLDPGYIGEIWISGPTVVEGYLNAPEVSRLCFVDGWFRTGDIGSFDEEGFLTVRGRLKEIINRGGEKISPMEIEIALLRHPEVAEAAAFAVPHPRLGEDVSAAVVLRPLASAQSDELRQFLFGQLAWFKIPRRILILEELPRGNTGKIQRRKLAEKVK